MPDSTLRPLPSFWKLQLLGWSAFLVAMSFSRVGRFPLSYMLVEKLLLTVLGVVASLALRAMLRPRVDAGRPMAVLIALCVVASYAIAAVYCAVRAVLAHGRVRVRGGEQLLLGAELVGAGATVVAAAVEPLVVGTGQRALALATSSLVWLGLSPTPACGPMRKVRASTNTGPWPARTSFGSS